MRIALRTRPAAIFGAVFAVALIAFLPMRLAVGALDVASTGFAARSVNGSVWHGAFGEARLGALPLGDVRASLSPFDLVLGRAKLSLALPGADPAPTGALVVGRHVTGFDATAVSLPAGAMFAPLPVSQLDLSDVTVRFEDDACTRAAGRVRAVLSGGIAGIDLGGAMSGEARCDAGALLLPLASAGGNDRVALRITGAGRYHADLNVVPDDPAAVAKLVLAGFRPSARGYVLSIDGSLRRR